MAKTLLLFLFPALFAWTFAGDGGATQVRADTLRKMLDLPVSAQANIDDAQPAGLSASLSGLSFLPDFTVTNQTIDPVFLKGIVKKVFLQNRKNPTLTLEIKFLVGSSGPADMLDMLVELLVNNTMPIDILLKRFAPIKGKYGELFLGVENPDGNLTGCFALARGNVGVVVSYHGENGHNLYPLAQTVDGLLRQPAAPATKFATEDTSYVIPEKLKRATAAYSKPLRKNKGASASVTINAVSNDTRLVVHKLPDESLEITSTGEKGKAEIGLVYFDPVTLNSSWKVCPVNIEAEK
jgi:hypothetical protein